MDPSLDLYETPGDQLDAFLKQNLQPQEDWKEEVQDAWKRMERFFRDQCFQDELVLGQEVTVLKVVKGGSSGKGTTLNHSSDLDMILFLNCFYDFLSQSLFRKYVIDFIEEKLDRCSRSLAYNVTVIQRREGNRSPRSLTLQIQPRKSSKVIRMDVLPAFDALGKDSNGSLPIFLNSKVDFLDLVFFSSGSFCPDSKPQPEIYEYLLSTFSSPGEFSPSFTQLQRHFVKSRPFKLKNLLRLVKFWYLKVRRSGKYRGVALPSKYALELLTIYAWEVGTDENENFNMDEGLVAVMKLLRDYKDICIYWTKYYDFQNVAVRNFIKQQLKKSRPIILDPADPTNNLGRGKGWDVVAKEAVYCLRQACCRTDDPSQDWHVQRARDVQVTVKQTGKESWTLSVNPYSPIWKMKAEIKRTNKTNRPNSQYRLSFQEPGGERLLLSSQQTLADYGIFSKVNIRVLETIPPEIQVFVKDTSGQSRPYAIHPDDTIRDLKEKIEEAGGPYVEDQILKFQGRTLGNRRSLADLDIEDCDTIKLVKRI
uniref:2'-5' oligoadenylate synthase n=1 Tax=Sciurus vulgaris TaxID=55149 RepID=A0A8D2CNQ4_SCIVU